MDFKVFLIAALLVFSSGIAAADELTGSCSSVSTQCELSINNLELCNTSGITKTYNASVSGEVADWLSIIPKKVTLDSGECGQLRTFTIANCYAAPGNYKAQISVTNGGTHTVTCDIKIEQGHEVEVEVVPSRQEVTQCEAAEYDVILTNNTIVPNQKTEAVNLSVSGIPKDWITLEKEKVIVEKGNPETVKLKVQAPCTQPIGTYDFEVTGSLFNPDFRSSDNAEYVIKEGQGLDIETVESDSTKYLACTEITKEYTLRFTNNGNKDDVFNLAIDGPGWAELSTEKLELARGESKDVKVIFTANSDEEKKYSGKITATSTLFDFKRTVDFTVELKDCFDLTVEKLEGTEKACVEKNPVYEFKITNGPVSEIDVDVSIEGAEATLSDDNFRLNPGQSRGVTAEINVSGLADEGGIKKRDVQIEILMDASGSMKNYVDGKEKLQVAKDAIVNFVNNITEVELGLRVFGHKEGCSDSEQLVPISKLNVAEITDKVSQFDAIGKTPVAETLLDTRNDFSNEGERYVILVSDGKESCEGSVREAAEELKKKGIVIYAIGFDIDQTGKTQLIAAVGQTGGEYFDAASEADLLDVFKKITRELDIEQSSKGEVTFTLDVKGDNFSFTKDYTIQITDCHNVAVSAPELNVCRGIMTNDAITLVNIGTEQQMVDISAEPLWIVPEIRKISLLPGKKEMVQITVDPPNEAPDQQYIVRTKSANIEGETKAFINYLSDASCYGFDLIVVQPQVDAATCEGKQQSLILENRGLADTEVTLDSDKGFVYFVDKTVKLAKNERKEVYFFISPPFDITEEDSLITITATNKNGVQGIGYVKLNLIGPGYGLEPVNIDIRDVVTNTKDVNKLANVDAIIEFNLYNDSNHILEIFSIEATNYPAAFIIQEEQIAPKDTAQVKMSVDLPDNFDRETATVALKIIANEGTFVRNVEFRTSEGAAPVTPDTNQTVEPEPVKPVGPETLSIGSGLLSLANIRNGIILLLLLTVMALIVYSVIKVTSGKKNGTFKEVTTLETIKETKDSELAKTRKESQKAKTKRQEALKKLRKIAKKK